MKKSKGRNARLITLSLLSGLSLLSLSLMLAQPRVAKATTLTVTSSADSGAGTLRQAIIDAADGGTINFAANITLIDLTSAELLINKNLTINGRGANLLTVRSAGNFRIFHITSGGLNTISGLTIANGNPAESGGGVFNQSNSTLTVVACAISGNSALNNGSFVSSGGGIYNFNSTVNLIKSTISGNSVGGTGGGIANNNGIVAITSSTILGNFATGNAGGGGGISNGPGTLTVTNSTISGNMTNGSVSAGGGIYQSFGTVNVRNTIIAVNTSANGPDVFGALTSQGYNLIGKNNGSTGFTNGVNNDQIGSIAAPLDPMLDPLAPNGGPTQTQALQSTSPAIERGHSSGSPTDQRGFARPVDSPVIANATGGDGSDIGAYEVQADQLPGCGNTLVTNNNDSGGGSLRFIIANICAGETITFDMSRVVSPINLTSDELLIDKNLSISGPGANLLTVQRSNANGTPSFRIFDIASGGSNVTISGLTITNGKTYPISSLVDGGGIYTQTNGGTLTVTGCVISGNSATGGGIGGGIYALASDVNLINSTISDNTGGLFGGGISNNNGTLAITNSIISGNASNFSGGGGIFNYNGMLTVTNSTLSGNSCSIEGAIDHDGGGGIQNLSGMLTVTNSTISGNSCSINWQGRLGDGGGGGINNHGMLTVTNSTISGNACSITGSQAGCGGGGIYNLGTVTITNSTISLNSTNRTGGGVDNQNGTVNAKNTIIARNTASRGSLDFLNTLTSQGFNLIGDTFGTIITGSTTGNQLDVADPKLGPLQNNGGPTFTQALLPGSTAIDKGSSGSSTDQRGFARPVGSPPVPNPNGGDGGDIGAFEVQAPSAVTLVGFTATSRHNSVLLDWQTGFEVSNLGFYVHRDDGCGPMRITDLIAGSALFAGANTALTAGRSYSWRDTRPLKKGTRYYLEDVDLDGSRRFHGPVFVETTADQMTVEESANSPLVSELNESDSRQQAASPLEPKAKLRKPNEPSLAIQGVIASQGAMKFQISSEGFYRITTDELIASGLDPAIDPRRLQLFVDGKELAMRVEGEEDGRLDPVDFIEFYAIGINSNFSNSRVYWLTANASGGRRIGKVSGPQGKISPSSFAYTVERNDRTIYFSSLLNGEAENFFGAVIASSPVAQTIFTPQVANLPGADATLEIALQGVTSAAHLVRIDLNGFEIGRLSFNGQAHTAASINLSQSLLREGTNAFTLTRLGDGSDISLVDFLRLTYQHTFVADNDSLRVTGNAGEEISISGFTSGKVRAFDVTDFGKVQEVEAKVELSKGNGGYVLAFNVPGSGSRTLLAVADSQLKHAVASADQPSSWRSPRDGADFVIIARREFLSAVEPLRALRQSQRLRVTLVDVEDIYDEFSYGQKTPQAIKDFLSFARAYWKTPPRYVLFAGDASLDPKNYLGLGDFDSVPTKLIDTNYLETASDDWFTDFSGDGLTSMTVGRLPFRTATEASTMIKKIVGYEQSSPSQEALLVADANDGFNFEAASDQLRPLIPANLRVQQINRGRVDAATAKRQLLEAIARGQKIVNYTGHGSANQWRGDLLSGEEARALRNGDRLPLFVMMTCLNGYFHDANQDSLAESLLKAEAGGAVAVWSSSGMTPPDGQALLNQEFYRSIFGSGKAGQLTLGDAILRAKASVGDKDIRRTWVLLGDPTMRLR